MRFILSTLLVLAVMTVNAQSKFEKKQGNVPDEIIYHGEVTFADLDKESEFKWFGMGYNLYEPDRETISYLKKAIKKYNMVVLMGTWCEDSHNMMPRLYKVLRMIDYPLNKFVMYGLDREKQGTKGEEKKYAVSSVPTVILFHDGQEIGRITELVEKSVEADLAAIIEEYEAE